MAQELGPLAPIAVAVLAIIFVVIYQPASGTLMGISLNWVAAIVIAAGGLLGAVQNP